ncbi:GNAT family N-acetyltransferase [Hyphococcus luteus]|uniref:GNAT family N-acetyltransferase n=1 Tax=Hyphococcus luteus TaxID=2058213 RepID=A0A2S7K9Z3_9PROT|nr:GNAT family N-acetyltransferase [Marinicaulis flavus]PQA89340.1 GNAT family N-acetyltransferase [Marinicaulis flavus]
MAGDVIIRKAAPDDAGDIQAMIAALARDVDGPAHVLSVEDVKRHGFGDAPDFRALIAECGGEIIGLALYFPEFSTWRGKRGVYLQDIYVKPEARGRGVGEKLIAQLAREAKAMGAVYLRLAVDRDNLEGARFYKRLRFTEVERDRIFKLDGDAFDAFAETE